MARTIAPENKIGHSRMADLLIWIESHPGTAAWVQAVFSVLAIIGAIWIADRQHAAARRHERERQGNADVRRLEIITAVITHALVTASDLKSAWAQGDPQTISHFDAKRLLDFKMVLEEIPPYEIPSEVVILYIRPLARVIGDVYHFLDSTKTQKGDPACAYEWQPARDVPDLLDLLVNLAERAKACCIAEMNLRRDPTRS